MLNRRSHDLDICYGQLIFIPSFSYTGWFDKITAASVITRTIKYLSNLQFDFLDLVKADLPEPELNACYLRTRLRLGTNVSRDGGAALFFANIIVANHIKRLNLNEQLCS